MGERLLTKTFGWPRGLSTDADLEAFRLLSGLLGCWVQSADVKRCPDAAGGTGLRRVALVGEGEDALCCVCCGLVKYSLKGGGTKMSVTEG